MKFLKTNIRPLLWMAALLLGPLLASCRGKDDVPAPAANRNTLLMYVVGDNSISNYMQQSVNAVVSGMDPSYLLDNTVLIYVDAGAYDGRSGAPQLLEVIPFEGGTTTRTIAEYPEQNSADYTILAGQIEIMRNDFPATEGYGLMVSSHGTGWLPGDFPSLLRSRAIGQDGSNWIELDRLAEAIPDGALDYILLDACYMGAVEVAYALREKADYLIATPTELWAEGMPYAALGSSFFGPAPDPRAFCDALFARYDNPGRGSTVSLIETAPLDELATLLGEVFRGKKGAVIAHGVAGFQPYGTSAYKEMFFDLADFVASQASVAQLAQFEALMARAVPYSRHSNLVTFPNALTGWYIERYSGLSSYVPRGRYPALDAAYAATEWGRAIY